MTVTVLFTVITVALEMFLGTLMALVMQRSFKGRSLLRASVLVPWAIPTAVTAKLWYFMFAYDGVVNRLLGTHILWTDGQWASRFAVIVGDVWKTTPFVALLVLAGLQIIPTELYEAARVDGASAGEEFAADRHGTPGAPGPAGRDPVPDPGRAARIYDLPAILTHGGGGTGHATTTLSILVIAQLEQGYGGASALSTITFLFIFAVAFLMVKLFNASVIRTQQSAVK